MQFASNQPGPVSVLVSRMSLYYPMLAMTLWKLDERDTARDVLRLVVDPPLGFTREGPESHRLIREARELIQPSEPPQPKS